MEIQQDKADFLGIKLCCEFIGFENNNFLICTDMYRLQQVLLNL